MIALKTNDTRESKNYTAALVFSTARLYDNTILFRRIENHIPQQENKHALWSIERVDPWYLFRANGYCTRDLTQGEAAPEHNIFTAATTER